MSQSWLKFYPSDWRADPALRMCSLAARGLWMEMLCLMHEAEPRGHLLVNGRPLLSSQLAALAGCSAKDADKLVAELEAAGVFSRNSEGVIFSRRIRRDVERDAADRYNGAKGGAPGIRRGSVDKALRVRPFKKSDAPGKAARIFAKTAGKCFWCDVALIEEPSEDQFADGFHVDHLLPVCDGGTNDEDNLVPACAVCNHDRNKIGWPANSRRKVDPIRTKRADPTLWGVSVGSKSDSKAQKPDTRSQIPDTDAASSAREKFDRLERDLREAAGCQNSPYPGLMVLAPILGLIDAGADLVEEILPAIRARPKPDASSWAYFVPQIQEFRAKRQAARDAPTPQARAAPGKPDLIALSRAATAGMGGN